MPAIIPDNVTNNLSDNAPDSTSPDPAHGNNTVSSIGVISDGTAGMRLQAVALGEAIRTAKNKSPILDDIIISPPYLLRHLPRLSRYLPLAWLRAMLGPKITALSGSSTTIIITCGRRMAGLSIAVRRLGMSSTRPGRPRTIHIQDPRLPPQYFDILVVPQHDPARGPNVITSMGSLNRLDDAKITAAAATLDPKWINLPSPCIAVLLGGRNQRYDISAVMIDQMARKLAKFATSAGASLALVPSRRTPDKLLIQLTDSLKTTPHAVMNAKDENPYPGILGHATAIIVTSDSVNMTSEAAITGKPVLIAEWQVETGRIGLFHKAMMKAGHTAPLGDGIPKTDFTPLFEMPLILRQVIALLMR